MMYTDNIYQDGAYLVNNPTWHVEDSPWKSQQITNMLEKNHIQLTTLCEIGCGAGEILKCLANIYGNEVELSGYEISSQAFEICKQKSQKNLHFFNQDLLEEPGKEVFDIVMAIDVFEHVEDYFGFLRKLRNKGTYKMLHIPLDLSVQAVLRTSPILHARSSVGHIHYFTKETALATLHDIGYEVIDYSYTSGSLSLPNLRWQANLMKLPRKLLFAINEDLTVKILGGFSLLVLAK
jgi:cyclopropane fatty-acyl-phospholipid synthase-like methyltransferase